MPANKYALLRYRIIDRCISNDASPYPTKDDLRLACEEALYGSDGDRVSESTIEKDLWAMRNEGDLGYYAPIAYSKTHKGYYYEEEGYTINDINLNDDDLEALHFAAETFLQFRDIPIFKTYQQAIDKVVARLKISPDEQLREDAAYIQFEEAPAVEGMDHLAPLAEAIRGHQLVKIEYEKFSDGSIKPHDVHPYLLKEYRNRWYLISFEPSSDDFRTYALDRIRSLKVSKRTFEPDDSFSSDRFFKHSIGITELDSDPQHVVLKCQPTLGKYFETQPLHHSQKLTKKQDHTVIELDVLVTYELVSEILCQGPSIEVISPDSLRERISESIEAALRQYK